MPLLCMLLTVVWAVIYDQVTGNSDMIGLVSKNDSIRSKNQQLFESIPIIFFYLHGVSCIVLLFTRWGRAALHESQGKRYCQWCAFSLLLAAYYTINSLVGDQDRHIDEDGDIRGVTLTILLSVGMMIFHHIGFSQYMSVIMLIFGLSLWIIYMTYKKMSIPVVLEIIISCCIIFTGGWIQEYEYKRTFSRPKEDQNKKSRHGFFPIVTDVSYALSSIDKSITIMHGMLEEEGLIHAERYQEGIWFWNARVACLHEQRIICQAIYVALLLEDPSKESDITYKTQFSFKKICSKVFGMFEATLGHSLPLYTDDNASEIFVTASQGIFELVIFLLTYDAVRGVSPGICSITIDSHDGAWFFNFQITILEEHEKNIIDRENTLGMGNIGMGLARGGIGMGMDNDLISLARSLLPDDNIFGKTSPMERLANRIAERYLNSKIDFLEPEHKNGLAICRRSLQLPESMASNVQGLSMPASFQSGVRQNWLFVEQKVSDVDGFVELREKLGNFAIPIHTCAGHELRNLSGKHRVVIVHESQLLNFREAYSQDIPKSAFGMLVLCDTNNEGKLLESDYPTIAMVKTSIKSTQAELYHCIQELTTKQQPRPAYDDEVSKTVPGAPNFNLSKTNISKKAAKGVRSRTVSVAPANSNGNSNLGNVHGPSVSSALTVGQSRYYNYHPIKEVVSIPRLLKLLERFETEIREHKITRENHDIVVSGIEGCRQRIDTLRLDSMAASVQALENKLQVEEVSQNIVWSNLESHQKRAKYLLDNFNPLLSLLRSHVEANNLKKVFEVSNTCARKSTEIGMKQLTCWFTTLQDVTGLINAYYSNSNGDNHSTNGEAKLKLLPDILEDFADADADGDESVDETNMNNNNSKTNNFESNSEVNKGELYVPMSNPLEKRIPSILLEIIDTIEIAVWDAAVDKVE